MSKEKVNEQQQHSFILINLSMFFCDILKVNFPFLAETIILLLSNLLPRFPPKLFPLNHFPLLTLHIQTNFLMYQILLSGFFRRLTNYLATFWLFLNDIHSFT